MKQVILIAIVTVSCAWRFGDYSWKPWHERFEVLRQIATEDKDAGIVFDSGIEVTGGFVTIGHFAPYITLSNAFTRPDFRDLLANDLMKYAIVDTVREKDFERIGALLGYRRHWHISGLTVYKRLRTN